MFHRNQTARDGGSGISRALAATKAHQTFPADPESGN